MPELPEVEILVRHLAPLLEGKRIRGVQVNRAKVLAPTSTRELSRALVGAKFAGLTRRGKYLLFTLRSRKRGTPLKLLGHLGMTGRIYLQHAGRPLPKHTAVALHLGSENLVFEDTRYFGRLTLDTGGVARLGPEPLESDFTVDYLMEKLKRTTQPIKVKLLDQTLIAGVGNLYASEVLFRAGISPRLPARKLKRVQVKRLRQAIRDVLAEAIKCGSTIPLNYAGAGEQDGLFYFGRGVRAPDYYEERLFVYDRQGRPCQNCGAPIKRLVQAARSTFYCPRCQRR